MIKSSCIYLHRYWNCDERDYFMHQTTNNWRGLRNKNLDRGIFINNDLTGTSEEYKMVLY